MPPGQSRSWPPRPTAATGRWPQWWADSSWAWPRADPAADPDDAGRRFPVGIDQQVLVTEAELLLAVLDGLTMHALLQPEWMTALMCKDVLETHLEGLNRRLAAGQPAVNAS